MGIKMTSSARDERVRVLNQRIAELDKHDSLSTSEELLLAELEDELDGLEDEIEDEQRQDSILDWDYSDDEALDDNDIYEAPDPIEEYEPRDVYEYDDWF